ncbi:MAG: diheme cytochrome c [Pseudomonadota bacterium]
MLSALPACGGSGGFPVPDGAHLVQARQSWPTTELHELEAGRKLYLSRCGNCHRPFEPGQLDAGQWPAAVTEMRDQAKLSDEQVDAITKYIVTMSKYSRRAGHPTERSQ